LITRAPLRWSQLVTMDREAYGDVHLMVATNVLGRGLDVEAIRWVINYDAPLKVVVAER